MRYKAHEYEFFNSPQKTEKQKFTIKENVMSEPVKMPVRHFLRRDYLHISFYSKFLLFVCFYIFLFIYKSYMNYTITPLRLSC